MNSLSIKGGIMRKNDVYLYAIMVVGLLFFVFKLADYQACVKYGKVNLVKTRHINECKVQISKNAWIDIKGYESTPKISVVQR